MKKINKSFNVSGRVPVKPQKSTEREFSHRELLSKLNHYERQAQTKEQGDKIRQIRKSFKDYEVDKHGIRAVRNRNYNMGLWAGIHLYSEPHKLIEGDEVKDQKIRNQKVKEARSLYRNFGVTSIFKSKSQKEKIKDNG